MGGIVSILISAGAAFLLYGVGHPILFAFAVVVALLAFWSVGVMHNYGSYARRDRAARLRDSLRAEGAFDSAAQARLAKFERGVEPQAIPNWLSGVNMLLTVIALVLLITAFIVR